MNIEFDRPDYCKGCHASDFYTSLTSLYADGLVVENDVELKCRHDLACAELNERIKRVCGKC